MQNPLVSVGLPVRDGADYLPQALESLLGQNFGDFELIISDNASQDETPQICSDFAARDPRIRLHRFAENVGAARNYNQVFHLARGEFFKWAAHDDVCLPSFLERCLEAFSRAPGTVLVYPRSELINAAGTVTGLDVSGLSLSHTRPHVRLRSFFQKVRLANPVFGLIRSNALRQTRLIDAYVSSDIVLLAELLMLGEFHEVGEILFRRRLHRKRSLDANRSYSDLLAWFDPAKREQRQWISVPMRLSWECTRSTIRMPLSLPDRLRCLAVTARWQWWPALRQAPSAHNPLEDRRLRATRKAILRRVPAGVRFILVDEDQLRLGLHRAEAIPFLEREGRYWGPPQDDIIALQEFRRLCEAGAKYIVFAWPAFWWLEYYRGLAEHLAKCFRCIYADDRLRIWRIG